MNNAYYILEDGEQRGPFGFNELVRMELDINTQIMKPTAEDWDYAYNFPELYPYFAERGIYFPTGDNLASFGWRFLAWLLAYVLLSLVLGQVLNYMFLRGVLPPIKNNDLFSLPPSAMLLMQLVFSVILIAYNTICEASTMKGSIGKRICRIVVVDVNGMGLSFFNALLRSI